MQRLKCAKGLPCVCMSFQFSPTPGFHLVLYNVSINVWSDLPSEIEQFRTEKSRAIEVNR